jgi:YegS/Rv2252/BmrU family lipid kinase
MPVLYRHLALFATIWTVKNDMLFKSSSDGHNEYMNSSPDRNGGSPLPVSASNRRLLVIFNPAAGRRRPGYLDRALAAAKAAGAGIELLATQAAGDAETMAARAVLAGGYDAIVAAGGDGTINEVINGMASAAEAAGLVLPALGIVPLGTANVLAHELGLAAGADQVGRWLAAAKPRSIQLGRANGRLFVQMAGVGMDARVVAGIDPVVKRRLGKGAYALGSLREILAGPRLDYRVSATGPDGAVTQLNGASCIICNGHYYGGTFVLAPAARLDAACFQLVLFQRPGCIAALSYATAMVLGQIPRRADVTLLPVVAVEIDGPAGEPVQGDGDIIARLPVRIDRFQHPLAVLAPASL